MAAAAYSPRKYHVKGLIELTYQNYTEQSTTPGRTSKTEWNTFEQRYRLGLEGFIYNPKLFIYSANVSYYLGKTQNSGDAWRNKAVNYDLSASFLQSRPVSVDIFALKVNSTIEGIAKEPYDIASLYYGARLRFTKKKYPSVRLEYTHWGYTIERTSGERIPYEEFYGGESPFITFRERRKIEIDRYNIFINGALKSIGTTYNLSGNISVYSNNLSKDISVDSNPVTGYTGKYFFMNTYTILKKDNIFSTSFRYNDIDSTKLLSLITRLNLSPIGRFHHNYAYEYLASETYKEKIDAHTFSTNLLYRFSKKIYAYTHLRYTLAKRDGTTEDSYEINAGLNYGRLIKQFDFSSGYQFSLHKDTRRAELKYMSHKLSFGLTRRVKVGKIYSEYVFTYRTIDYTLKAQALEQESLSSQIIDDYLTDYQLNAQALEQEGLISQKTNDTEHRFKVGINGKGPGRTYWTGEAEVRILDASELHDGAWRTVWIGGEQQFAQKIRHYTFRGDIGYNITRKGTAYFKMSYTTGKTNSLDVNSYIYEIGFRYKILRDLNATASWMEKWWSRQWWIGKTYLQKERNDIKIREYKLELNYRLHRVTLTFLYHVYKTEMEPNSYENRRFYLQMSRSF
jgi:hypothetical protein